MLDREVQNPSVSKHIGVKVSVSNQLFGAVWWSQLVSAPTAAEIGQHEQEENESVFSDTSFPLDGSFAHHDTESSAFETDS